MRTVCRSMACMTVALFGATTTVNATDQSAIPGQIVAICADMTLDYAAMLAELSSLGLQSAPDAALPAIQAVCEAVNISEGLRDPLSVKAQARIREETLRCFKSRGISDGSVVETGGLASADAGIIVAVRLVEFAATPSSVTCHLATYAPYKIDTTNITAKPEIESSNHLGSQQIWMPTPLVRFVLQPNPGTFLDSLRPDQPMASSAALVIRPDTPGLM